MDSNLPPSRPLDRPAGSDGSIRIWLLLLLVLYAGGLCRDIAEPWVGLHDWNGAFFSQLARNLLRYPASLHHGMPLVATGAEPPSPAECSIYATHPPAMVWLVAGSFRALGESEITARLVPILASLASLGLLVWLVHRAAGRSVALLTGAIYAVMPMSVYFGRMVNHEAVCLFCMLAAIAAWSVMGDVKTTALARRWATLGWAAVMTLGIWVDWPMLLFAGLFCIGLLRETKNRRIGRRGAIAAIAIVVLAASSMAIYLVHAGLDGRWDSLVAIFLSRTTNDVDAGPHLATSGGGTWAFTVANLSWPVLACTVAGMFLAMRNALTRRTATRDESPAAAPEGCRVAKTGLTIIAITGLVWLLVFWRQYERHHYWMFYLGPAAAILTANTLVAIQRHFAGRSRASGRLCLAALIIITGVFTFRGGRDYFAADYPGLRFEVQAWKDIHARTLPGDRLLLHRDPILEELRGGYRFRNIVPPQLAYYLDRSFDVQSDIDRVPLAANTHAMFVLPIADAVLETGSLTELRARYREESFGASVVFHLRPPSAKRNEPVSPAEGP